LNESATLKKKHKKKKNINGKKSNKIANIVKENDSISYMPCNHTFRNKLASNLEQKCLDSCHCKKRGMCDKYCNCDPLKCEIMYSIN